MSAKTPKGPLQLLYAFGSSYALSCVLLLFLFLLTFLGTLEQTELGLYDVQKKYFESAFLVHWLFNKIPVPLPGAYLVMILLAINLTLGGVIKMGKGWADLNAKTNKDNERARAALTKRSIALLGVAVVHGGILLLLLAGFVKLKFSDDGFLTLYEEGRAPQQFTSSDEFQSYHEWEIAVFDGSQAQNVKEYLIPGEQFLFLPEGKTRTFKSPDLPFDVVVTQPVRNCRVMPVGPMWKPENPVIDGYALREEPLAKENEMNVAGAYVTIVAGAERTDAILYGNERAPLPVKAGGKTWGVDLRKKRFKMPFTISLTKFTRELHPRTNTPKVFMSEVRKIQDGREDTLEIEMNEPLRHEGLTLFQASWGPADARPGDPLFSTFAVVRNPSDYWPLYACIIITVGLLIAFVLKLVLFVMAQVKKWEQEEEAALE